MPKRPKIDPEIQGLLRQRTPEEYADLETSILIDGPREPLVVWQETGILLDGHGRLEICERHGKTYQVVYYKFPNRELAIEWVRRNQRGRRNLTPEEMSYNRGKDYLAQKHTPGRPGKQPHSEAVSGDTAGQIAKKHGVSRATVQRDAEFARAVDALPPQERQEVLSGEKSRTEVTRPAPSTPRRKKASKNGQIDFDMRAFESAYGVLYRTVDEAGSPHKAHNTPAAEGLRRLLAEWKKQFKAWHQKLTKEKR